MFEYLCQPPLYMNYYSIELLLILGCYLDLATGLRIFHPACYYGRYNGLDCNERREEGQNSGEEDMGLLM